MAKEMEINIRISFYSCHGYRLTLEISRSVNHQWEGCSSGTENLPGMHMESPVFDFQHHKNANHPC